MLGSEPPEATGLNVGWSDFFFLFFSHWNQNWSSDPKAKFLSDHIFDSHVFCITNPSLISVLLCLHLCCHLVCVHAWPLQWEMYLHFAFLITLCEVILLLVVRPPCLSIFHSHTINRNECWNKGANLPSCSLSLNEVSCLHCFLCGVRSYPELISAVWIPPKQEWNSQAGWSKELGLPVHISCSYIGQLSTCFLLDLRFLACSKHSDGLISALTARGFLSRESPWSHF